MLMSISLSAQYLVVSSDSVGQVFNDYSDTEHKLSAMVYNTSTTDTMEVRWDRTLNDYPSDWSGSQVCVGVTCYFFTVSEGDFTLLPGDSMQLDMSYVNDGLSGIAKTIVQLTVDRDNSADVVFYANLGNLTTGIEDANSNGVNVDIYPNPAKDYLLVKRGKNDDIERIEIYNMLGIKVLSQEAGIDGLTTRVDLMDLSKGVYMVRVFDRDNNVLMTRAVSKTR